VQDIPSELEKMYTVPHQEWFQKRIQIADEVVAKYPRDGIMDAELVLCCAISGLAAIMWPGEGLDKFRYTQFLVKFAPPAAKIQTVGLYYLIEKLDKTNPAEAQILINSFFSSRSEYDGKLFLDNGSLPASLMLKIVPNASTIDQPESAILSLLPAISLKEVRASSYAAIIYSNLRNSLVHQYQFPESLASYGPANSVDMPSYANIPYPPDEVEVQKIAAERELPVDDVRVSLSQTRRRLFFPYAYIRNVAVGAASAAFSYWDSVDSWTSPPSTSGWWINGGRIL
jgi:hypothetical protein